MANLQQTDYGTWDVTLRHYGPTGITMHLSLEHEGESYECDVKSTEFTKIETEWTTPVGVPISTANTSSGIRWTSEPVKVGSDTYRIKEIKWDVEPYNPEPVPEYEYSFYIVPESFDASSYQGSQEFSAVLVTTDKNTGAETRQYVTNAATWSVQGGQCSMDTTVKNKLVWNNEEETPINAMVYAKLPRSYVDLEDTGGTFFEAQAPVTIPAWSSPTPGPEPEPAPSTAVTEYTYMLGVSNSYLTSVTTRINPDGGSAELFVRAYRKSKDANGIDIIENITPESIWCYSPSKMDESTGFVLMNGPLEKNKIAIWRVYVKYPKRTGSSTSASSNAKFRFKAKDEEFPEKSLSPAGIELAYASRIFVSWSTTASTSDTDEIPIDYDTTTHTAFVIGERDLPRGNYNSCIWEVGLKSSWINVTPASGSPTSTTVNPSQEVLVTFEKNEGTKYRDGFVRFKRKDMDGAVKAGELKVRQNARPASTEP